MFEQSGFEHSFSERGGEGPNLSLSDLYLGTGFSQMRAQAIKINHADGAFMPWALLGFLGPLLQTKPTCVFLHWGESPKISEVRLRCCLSPLTALDS